MSDFDSSKSYSSSEDDEIFFKKTKPEQQGIVYTPAVLPLSIEDSPITTLPHFQQNDTPDTPTTSGNIIFPGGIAVPKEETTVSNLVVSQEPQFNIVDETPITPIAEEPKAVLEQPTTITELETIPPPEVIYPSVVFKPEITEPDVEPTPIVNEPTPIANEPTPIVNEPITIANEPEFANEPKVTNESTIEEPLGISENKNLNELYSSFRNFTTLKNFESDYKFWKEKTTKNGITNITLNPGLLEYFTLCFFDLMRNQTKDNNLAFNFDIAKIPFASYLKEFFEFHQETLDFSPWKESTNEHSFFEEIMLKLRCNMYVLPKGWTINEKNTWSNLFKTLETKPAFITNESPNVDFETLLSNTEDKRVSVKTKSIEILDGGNIVALNNLLVFYFPQNTTNIWVPLIDPKPHQKQGQFTSVQKPLKIQFCITKNPSTKMLSCWRFMYQKKGEYIIEKCIIQGKKIEWSQDKMDIQDYTILLCYS